MTRCSCAGTHDDHCRHHGAYPRVDEDLVSQLLALVESSVAESAADLGLDEDEVFWDVAQSVVRFTGPEEIPGLLECDQVEACRVLGVEWA